MFRLYATRTSFLIYHHTNRYHARLTYTNKKSVVKYLKIQMTEIVKNEPGIKVKIYVVLAAKHYAMHNHRP